MRSRISIIVASVILSFGIEMLGCTSAIVAGYATRDGRPLLWKHRDTGEENNKVERIEARNGRMEYIALYNASDKDCREAWMGYNTAGFAIMNTASYNLKDDNVKEMDKEGVIMAEALGVCRTVDDFERFLINHKKPLRVEANFGVIDALGNGAYFEVNNHSYTKFDLKDAPGGVLVRTNYSHSGRVDEGMGYIREKNAEVLLAPHILAHDITPATFTEELSRSFYHSLLGTDASLGGERWVIDRDYIPRRISTASCVVEGVAPGEDASMTTMWVAIGYPPCAEVRMARTGEDGVPAELRGTLPSGHSPLCDEAVERKHQVFPITRGSGSNYLDISLLFNAQGTGYSQILKIKNLDYYSKNRR